VPSKLSRILGSGTSPQRLAGTAFGVGVDLEISDAGLVEETRRWLPLAWSDGDPGVHALLLKLGRDGDGGYTLERGDHVVSSGPADEVFDDLERVVRMHLALTASDYFFLHAGAVAWGDAGIVIPGASFSGKTSLVAALVRAGASYFSDEMAVLDRSGRLHPYPKPLGLRLTGGLSTQTNHHVDDLGGLIGLHSVSLKLVVAAEFRPTATWEPIVLSPAETVLVLMQHTFRGADRPQESMRTMLEAARDVTGLKGERGEADAVAVNLIHRIDPRSA
jgi:hypothetical protein